MINKDLKEFTDKNISSRTKFRMYSLFVSITAAFRNLKNRLKGGEHE